MQRLTGKTAIVTGSTRGIGKGIALAFAREGASVVVSGTKAHLCEEVTEQIRHEGGKAVGIPCDISDIEQINALITGAIKYFGELHIMVNNAGTAIYEPFLDISPETVKRMWEVNLFGTFFCGQRAAKEMIRQGKGGKIINVSSIMEDYGSPDLAAYGVAKGGVKIMTKCMALELAAHRINVNSIGPGVTATDINAAEMAKPGARESTINHIPWKRLGTPMDMAGAAIFLAGDESDYVTGTTLFVDGGITAQL